MQAANIGLILVVSLAVTTGVWFWATQFESPLEVTMRSEPGDFGVMYWRGTIRESGGTAAYQKLLATVQEWSYNHQHLEFHAFGEALYEAQGLHGIADCGPDIGYGCYHSFLGLALVEHGLDILEELDAACIERYGEKGLGCQHGIGHGILAMLGPEKLEEALAACKTLSWQGPLGGCMGGVFMEFNYNSVVDHKPRAVDVHGEYYPCTAVPEYARPSCYDLQPMWWGTRSNKDFTLLGAQCEATPEEAYRPFCYLGVGNVAARTAHSDIDRIKAYCAVMPSRAGELECIRGAALLISNKPDTATGWERICDDFSGADKAICLESYAII